MALIIANWKMNGKAGDIAAYLATLTANTDEAKQAQIVLCPPFPLLERMASGGFAIGAQDCGVEAAGAYTGSTSAALLQEIGCRYVIIGHSERRRDFAEDNVVLAKKLASASAAGLIPIFCIGEKQGETPESTLTHQLEALKSIESAEIVIAYEPVWAIGTGKVPETSQISEIHAFIQREVEKILPNTRFSILYGGSVTAENAAEILGAAHVGGVLVGGASLDAIKFAAIANIAP